MPDPLHMVVLQAVTACHPYMCISIVFSSLKVSKQFLKIKKATDRPSVSWPNLPLQVQHLIFAVLAELAYFSS